MDAATLHNSTSSPLLCLPPEIRNTIYEYVIGGNVIGIYMSTIGTPSIVHNVIPILPSSAGNTSNRRYRVSYPQDAIWPEIPAKPSSEAEIAEMNKHEEQMSRERYERFIKMALVQRAYGTSSAIFKHQQSYSRRRPRVNLKPKSVYVSMLWTCRQIYHEACLLLYSSNIFYFEYGPALEMFLLRSLNLKQAQAIKHVYILHRIRTESRDNMSEHWHSVFTPAVIDALPGVQTVSLLLSQIGCLGQGVRLQDRSVNGRWRHCGGVAPAWNDQIYVYGFSRLRLLPQLSYVNVPLRTYSKDCSILRVRHPASSTEPPMKSDRELYVQRLCEQLRTPWNDVSRAFFEEYEMKERPHFMSWAKMMEQKEVAGEDGHKYDFL
ncbi:uncharacterized protein BDZ99DRAFT_467543 [Mytilinidion resinicola]|uniref:DUF7730 domain-containing protein n=1 Tax=Mytilinidion resinicola TaxID=574789 RepID=A0A6A6Y6D1_9PEZI|nr:uncharacterized protein BDZ99DRAFT_467543 [Mytilinidion resinicola]KAF2804169.1 hypothetical protein BDZ99DRAFT_467543 [Mytilinidion resinicola]